MVKLVTAMAGLCMALQVGLSPAAAVTDATTRVACEGITKAQRTRGIDLVKLQAATDQLAHSSAKGAKTIANQLEASLAQDPPSPAFALRVARGLVRSSDHRDHQARGSSDHRTQGVRAALRGQRGR